MRVTEIDGKYSSCFPTSTTVTNATVHAAEKQQLVTMNGPANMVTTDKEGVFDSTFLEDTMLSEITQIQKDKYFHDLVYMWNLGGKVQFIEAESKMVATRSRGRGRVLVKGHKGSVMNDEEVLKI